MRIFSKDIKEVMAIYNFLHDMCIVDTLTVIGIAKNCCYGIVS